MESVNKHQAQQRIAHIYDIANATQATSKDINEHVKKIRKAAGLKQPAGDSKQFMKDIGSI